MSTEIVTVAPDATVRDMARLMRSHRVDALLVVNRHDDHLAGIVTEADILAKVAYGACAPGDLALRWEESSGWGAEWVGRALGLTAEQVMSCPVRHTPPDATMAEAARIMLEGRIKHLPVVSGHRVLGILSRSDLLRPFERSDTQLRADVDECLAASLADGARAPFAIVEEGIVLLDASGLTSRELVDLEDRLAAVPGVVLVRVVSEGVTRPSGGADRSRTTS